ncbi:hypothetical protein RJ639_017428, partial [Escallonia herrerae]
RSEGNPLDLNNLPEDYSSRDGKQVVEDTSSTAGHKKKKSGAKDGKDESGKVYECRFCSLKFCKSQALGGHMNRHRQERETETLNRARQLVFNTDNLIAPGPHHLGGQPVPQGGYHQAGNIADPALPFRSAYQTTRLFSSSSSSILPPPPPTHDSYMYTSPPSRLVSYSSQLPPNDYFVGHVLPPPGNSPYGPSYPAPPPDHHPTNYTCIGAPVGHGTKPGGGRDLSLNHQEEGLSWGRRVDPASINRYQDGFQ